MAFDSKPATYSGFCSSALGSCPHRPSTGQKDPARLDRVVPPRSSSSCDKTRPTPAEPSSPVRPRSRRTRSHSSTRDSDAPPGGERCRFTVAQPALLALAARYPKALLLPQPMHALAIHQPARPPDQRRHSTAPVPRMLRHDLVDPLQETRVAWLRLRLVPLCRSRQSHEPTGPALRERPFSCCNSRSRLT